MRGMASPDLMSRDYFKAARVALCVQIPVAILCLLVLDRGQAARLCGVALIGFWMVAALIAVRRPWNPSAMSLWFWKWGFLPCFAAMVAAAALGRHWANP